MNSRQRRTQRVYEHEVTLVCRDSEGYSEFDRRVDQAKGWLQWRAKRKTYISDRKQFARQTFKFRNAGLATMFALKWL